MFEAGTKYLSAFCSNSVSPLSASTTSSPHSPLFVGVVRSNASTRAANLAVAFFEAALRFFEPQHAGSVFLFDCAPRRGAPIPNVHKAPATATTAHRRRILSILIFSLAHNSFRKSIVERQRIPSPARPIHRTTPASCPSHSPLLPMPLLAPTPR